jgi:hypothetical protein
MPRTKRFIRWWTATVPAHLVLAFLASSVIPPLLSGRTLHGHLFAQTNVEPDIPEKEGKITSALRANPQPPKVDGHLNDVIWRRAQIISDFTQEDPENGKQPTEKTEVRVAFDEEAVYVAVRSFDSEPDQIIGRLTRRDVYSESDWIRIVFDSQHDHQTGYSFSVNPAGVQRDKLLYDDTQSDELWDAVWEVKTQIDDQGWTSEFRIPFSILRFPQGREQAWGFNVWRTINRKNETIAWIYKPRDAFGEVSRFGHLVGIGKIESPRHLETLPYFVSRETLEPDQRDFFSALGADLKYGIGSAFTLDATINPDFGQVEADPSVLNLSAFETFFPEKRPFFIEGSKIFRTPFTLFHSRRIGKSPERFKIEKGDQVLERPEITTVVGAAKLSGKTSTGISFGIMNAVTANEYAKVIDTAGQQLDRLIEPLTNYFVGRLKKDVLEGNSFVGLLATAVNRNGSESAHTSGIDWNLKLKHNAYSFSGQIAASYAGPSIDRKAGYGADITFAKTGGKWVRGHVNFSLESPEFRINDLGFLKRNNWIGTSFGVQILTPDPVGFVRRSFNDLGGWFGWNYNGNILSNGISTSNSIELMNYWWIGGGFSHNFRRLSDFDTFRGGSLILQPADYNWSIWISSDSRKSVVVSPSSWGGWDESGSKSNGYQLSVSFKPSKRIQFRISGGYNISTDAAQWVDNVDDDDDGNVDHYVYGELDTKAFDATVEGTISFTKDLTLQIYMQPFIAVGNYAKIKELTRPLSLDFEPYDYGYNIDFNNKYLNSNVVLRWEYRPGSRIYFVWSQSRSDIAHPGQFRFFRDMKDLLYARGTHIFLIKVDYWLNM